MAMISLLPNGGAADERRSCAHRATTTGSSHLPGWSSAAPVDPRPPGVRINRNCHCPACATRTRRRRRPAKSPESPSRPDTWQAASPLPAAPAPPGGVRRGTIPPRAMPMAAMTAVPYMTRRLRHEAALRLPGRSSSSTSSSTTRTSAMLWNRLDGSFRRQRTMIFWSSRGSLPGDRLRVRTEHRCQRGDRRLAAKGALTRRHLVQHRAEAEHIGSPIHLAALRPAPATCTRLCRAPSLRAS